MTLVAVEIHTRFKIFPLDNRRTSTLCSNPIATAYMSLHSSENMRCFFKCERMKFTIFYDIIKNNLDGMGVGRIFPGVQKW